MAEPRRTATLHYKILDKFELHRRSDLSKVNWEARPPVSSHEKYAQAKTRPKTGVCHTCKERKERSSMFFCTGCHGQQYCSEECQLKDWPIHKDMCRKLRKKSLPIDPSME